MQRTKSFFNAGRERLIVLFFKELKQINQTVLNLGRKRSEGVEPRAHQRENAIS
jgi:hypothetical protein